MWILLMSLPGEWAQATRVERAEVGAVGCAVDDQLGQRLASGGPVEDAPDAVAGRHVGACDARHLADQRHAVVRHRAVAGLPGNDAVPGKRWRYSLAEGF